VINKLMMMRTRWRFMQHLGITLMRAQAHMIFNCAIAKSRSQHITALPGGVRRAGHRRARGHAVGRGSAGGGRVPAARVGRECAWQLEPRLAACLQLTPHKYDLGVWALSPPRPVPSTFT
jgi:hypothetical protein